jgi:hypothetical protein
MTADEYLKAKVASPLSDLTIRSRTKLLSVGLTSAVVAHTGLIPSQIEGLGIVFSTTQQQSMLVVLMLTTCYCLVSFCLSARADYFSSGLKRKAYVEARLGEPGFTEESRDLVALRAKFDDAIYPLEADPALVNKLQAYRLVIDVAVPVAVGLYGVAALLWYLYRAA